MISSFLRATLFILLATKLSVCGAQLFDQAPVYETLFSQVDRLGLDRTYYVGEMEVRPQFFAVPSGFRIPAEMAPHAADDFGSVSVSLVEESFLAGLWDSSCPAGWASFHERYPDAGDLTQVSRVAFSDLGDQAAVFIQLGRGCLHAWFATYYLRKQDGGWVVTGGANFGEA